MAKTSPALSSLKMVAIPYCWTFRGPGAIPLRQGRRRVHRTRYLQLLQKIPLSLDGLGRTGLWGVERQLGQCPRHVCYPYPVAHGSYQGEVSARRLQSYHLVKVRTTTSASCSPISTFLLLLRLVPFPDARLSIGLIFLVQTDALIVGRL